ncbi:glycosyltransferase family 2 protein [Arcobacter roscoffensis]|uniref:Glycosyltransferase family 2 protein n=1 Tax=Arcobacter roscoffensis TaxID=2961520 RepID=A0ABY5E848_9BACT|nr:glycosyltransferase family 2 protein [Arcobacter roscoffensis]UTJ07345.1 glycosyltransferase family 2 protein [Arcobacter roscoffensis]
MYTVSIITPSYNSKEVISRTIDSVLSQTYQNWEMIIVDDVSKDNSNEIIKEYTEKDNRIKLINLDKNSGPAVARNKAIAEAKGRYIAFLDADDLWKPKKLEKQISFMTEKDCALSYSSYETMTEEGKLLDKVIMPPSKLSYKDLLKTNYIGCLTAIYDTQKVGKVYMPLIKKRQDYGLWLKILKKTDYAYCIEEPLATYRLMSNSVSSNKFKLLKYNYLLFREYEGFSSIKAFYYLCWNILIKLLKR